MCDACANLTAYYGSAGREFLLKSRNTKINRIKRWLRRFYETLPAMK